MKLTAHDRTVDIRWEDASDHIPRRIRETRDFYERGLLDDAYDRAPAGPVVDVGAHIGNHTLFFAAVMGRDVVALEPNPASYRQLGANITRNGLWRRVRALCAAAGTQKGWASLRLDAGFNSGATVVAYGQGDVPVVAIDDLGVDAAVLKIDVEGQAMAVLAGAVGTLERCKPLVYVETDNDQRIADLFEQMGYFHVGWLGATPTHIYESAE